VYFWQYGTVAELTKNALLQTVVFWAILPTGIIVITENGTSKKENISAVINHVGALGIDHYKTLLDHGYIIL